MIFTPMTSAWYKLFRGQGGGGAAAMDFGIKPMRAAACPNIPFIGRLTSMPYLEHIELEIVL